MTEISVEELLRMRQAATPHVLLDVREAHELAAASLEGALHVPMNDVPARLDELPADTGIVVMCHMGVRSAAVTAFLNANGFPHAVNLAGGIDAWSYAVDPAVPRY